MTEIARLDASTMSKLQKTIHNSPDSSGEIRMHFTHEFCHKTWFWQTPLQMPMTPSGDKVVYTVHKNYHFLLYQYMRQTLPAIRIKKAYRDKYRICWPHNVGTNIIKTGMFKLNDDIVQRIDSVWCDIHAMFYMKPGFRDHYNECVGNVPYLEDWNTSMPQYITNVVQPFYNCRDISQAFPILMCHKDVIKFEYTFRDDITKVLRMQQYSDKAKRWVDIVPRKDVLQGISSSGKLPIPELWGRYANVGTEEYEHHKFALMCPDEQQIKIWNTTHTYYTRDIISSDSKNSRSFGEIETLELNCKTPCLALHWVAANADAVRFNNYSNYTTQTHSLYGGRNPCATVDLTYDGNHHLKNLDADHFCKIEPFQHFDSAPSEPGYNGYSFAQYPMGLDAEVGVVLNKAKFDVQISDTDLYVVDDSDDTKDESEIDLHSDPLDDQPPKMEEISRPKFDVHVRLVIMRKLSFQLIDKEKGYYDYQLDHDVV